MDIKLQPNITGTNVNLVKGATQADLTNAVNNSKSYRDESEAFSVVSENKSIIATDSANSAASNATTASNAANTATTKANEANSSAISASASETVCIDKTIIATDKADIATAQAVIATNKASEASTDADTATTQASIATTKASEASTSASNALTSANNADISEANALTYRNEAESFASSVNPSNIVHINGTETITGDKTFSGTVSGLTKATVGLSNVDNTSDANKPISTATQTALNTKVDKVTSTDNAVVRFNGTTGDVQNSGVIIDDNGNVGIGMAPLEKLYLYTGSASNVIIKTQNSAASCQYGNDNAGYAYAWSADAPAMFVGTSKSDGSIRLYAGGGEKARIDSNGNLLLQSGTGGLGYGTGAGGTVTQLTSKSTAVTLNKPTGTIIMNNSALAAGASVFFQVNNVLIGPWGDTVLVGGLWSETDPIYYRIEALRISGGSFTIRVTNITDVSLSEALIINFAIIKGATA